MEHIEGRLDSTARAAKSPQCTVPTFSGSGLRALIYSADGAVRSAALWDSLCNNFVFSVEPECELEKTEGEFEKVLCNGNEVPRKGLWERQPLYKELYSFVMPGLVFVRTSRSSIVSSACSSSSPRKKAFSGASLAWTVGMAASH